METEERKQKRNPWGWLPSPIAKTTPGETRNKVLYFYATDGRGSLTSRAQGTPPKAQTVSPRAVATLVIDD